MEYVYAALLLHKTGKEINEANLKKVMQAVDVKIDEGKIKSLVASLNGVDIEKALAEAKTMSFSNGHSTEAKAEKKEEKHEEKNEPAAEGLAALFG
ncbi:hypothetical protein AUJ10_00605 [Candidatus Pacearchaeota archaeon CG1_02_31_27]|nr:MAG: hypothetical protein AUJ10_00605 [Candidatus Pacearchaeota archaeon CG1_02_31_27]PIN92317.1 MAG: 50S ribosomal protein P1 [Candidatus Pacearchaeota archaeon CG10_big_fil_rev_8_21_14_0_10_31_59]PIZ79985.1 MAG: 50S ribosomal protein P1 [Candidatus Pacearchaeota archaeon CG_4_10_14_0_2_um_filter_31_10]